MYASNCLTLTSENFMISTFHPFLNTCFFRITHRPHTIFASVLIPTSFCVPFQSDYEHIPQPPYTSHPRRHFENLIEMRPSKLYHWIEINGHACCILIWLRLDRGLQGWTRQNWSLEFLLLSIEVGVCPQLARHLDPPQTVVDCTCSYWLSSVVLSDWVCARLKVFERGLYEKVIGSCWRCFPACMMITITFKYCFYDLLEGINRQYNLTGCCLTWQLETSIVLE